MTSHLDNLKYEDFLNSRHPSLMVPWMGAIYPAAGGAGASGYAVDNSAVFNDDDSQYLIRENASASTTGGSDARKKFTVSLWWKHGNIPSGGQNLFIQRNSSSNYLKCGIAGSGGNEGALQFFAGTLGAFNTGDTSAVLRDFHAWYHILFYYDSTDATAGNRARIYLNGVRLTDFQTSATNPSSGAITQFGSNNAMVINQQQGGSQYGDGYMAEMVVIDGQALTPSSFTETDSNGVLRPLDISAQNFTFGDQGFYLPFTDANSLGADYSGVTTSSFTSQNTESGANEINKGDMDASGLTLAVKFKALSSTAVPQVKIHATSTGFSSATIRIETGSSTAPSGTLVDSNGELTGFTSSGSGLKTITFPNGGPVLTAGTEYWLVLAGTGNWGVSHDYGTTNQVVGSLGLRKASGFDANQSFGHEIYQVGNNFEAKNSPTQTTDSPTKNSATITPLFKPSTQTLSHGNLRVTATGDNNGRSFSSVAIPSTGKWYFEVKMLATGQHMAGVIGESGLKNVTTSPHDDAAGFTYHMGTSQTAFNNGNAISPALDSSDFSANDILGVAVDMDANKLWFARNNSWYNSGNPAGGSGEIYSTLTEDHYFATARPYGSGKTLEFNFGATAFAYTPPTGFNGWNTTTFYEASAPAIEDGSAHFRASAFEGNALASRDIIQSTQAQANLETGNNETNNGDMSGTAAGIKFVCTRTGKCPSIHIRTSSTGMSGVTCQIKEDGGTGQSPSGSVLTNGEKTGVSFSGQGYAIFDFPNGGPELTAGTTYWFMIPSDTGTWGIARDNDNSEGGPGGRIGSSDGSYNTGSFGHKIFQVFGSQFQPDLVWGKNRNLDTHGHRWFDAVRGATKVLQSSAHDQEATDANGLTAFNSNGFEIGNGDHLNGNGNGIIAWQWLAGNGTSSNSNGSITSTVSVNQTAGFSIVSWTGSGANATIGHGLGAVPEWILVKNRDSAGNNWAVYHVGQGNTHVSFLDSTNAMTPADRWQDTTPTSTVFSVDGTTDVNKSTDDMIAYCWCGKPGFSKFGSYEGNNSSDGSYIHLGFRPAFFIAKNIDFTGAWLMFDSAREPFNLMDLPLEADDTKAEAASGGRELDFLSNGVKLRGNSSYLNSSDTFIYMAFAEHPFAGLTPATAK